MRGLALSQKQPSSASWLSVSGRAAEDVIRITGIENLNGKIVLDASDPLDFSSGRPGLFVGTTDSLGEISTRKEFIGQLSVNCTQADMQDAFENDLVGLDAAGTLAAAEANEHPGSPPKPGDSTSRRIGRICIPAPRWRRLGWHVRQPEPGIWIYGAHPTAAST